MTRSCRECGALAEEGENFCGSCGAYLEWEDDSDSPPVPVDEQVSTEAGAGEEVRADEPAPLWKQVTEQARRVIERPSEPSTALDLATTQGAGPKDSPHPTGAQAPLSPSTTADPPRETIELRRPTAPVGPPPLRQKPVLEERMRPGDLVCGSCGIGNTPTRKFCRRCGHDLVEALVVHVPWWRRLFVRRRATHAAGTRPSSRKTPRLLRPSGARRLLPVALVLLLLTGGAYAARDRLSDAAATVLDVVKGSEGFEASGVSATSAAPGHPARSVIDTDPTKFWAPAGDPRGQSVTATFAEPQRLVHLLLSPGASVSKKSAWVTVGRPRTVVVVLDRRAGADERKTVELADEMGPVQIDLGVSDVTAVTLRLQRSYPGQSQDLVALGELEFFVRE